MAMIVSVHSFRGGTGKSNTTANLAAVLASDGLRVGVIDADIQSPGIHVIFGMRAEEGSASLNDFLCHCPEIADVGHDVTNGMVPRVRRRVFLTPSQLQPA